MRKWVYLIIGIVLVVNGIVALIHMLFPTTIFQALWGILGLWLIYKAAKLFRKPKVTQKE